MNAISQRWSRNAGNGNRLRVKLLLALAAVSLLLAACGGSTRKEPDETVTPAPTVVLAGSARELVDLMNQGLEVTYNVSYGTSSPEGEAGDVYVIFYKPPRARVDSIAAGTNAPSSILIGGDKETKTINCTGGPGRWRCVEIDPLGDSLLRAAGPILFLNSGDIGGYDVAEQEQRPIAGEAARCFRLTPKTADGGEPAEYCFSAGGVPLYTESAIGTVEATAFSAEVSDDDFTPPAEPQPQ